MKLAKLLYRPEEVAELLSYKKSKIYNLVAEGKLEAHRENGEITKPLRILAVSIEQYVQQFTLPAPEAPPVRQRPSVGAPKSKNWVRGWQP